MRTNLRPWIPLALLTLGVSVLPACATTQTQRSNYADDFYLHVNQDWLAENPIPAAYGSWGVFHEINEGNKEVLHTILIDAAAQPNSSDTITRQLGALWSTGMNAEAIEASGIDGIRAHLESIDQINDHESLARVVAQLQLIDVDVMFGLGSEADLENSSETITFMTPGGLGLPEKDYYLRDDDDSVQLQLQYVQHIANMLALTGTPVNEAGAAAERIFALELAMAEQTLGAVEYRDPQILSNKIPTSELALEITPEFDWSYYFDALGVNQQPVVNLIGPRYFKHLNTLLQEQPLQTWKEYLRWHLITRSAPFLNSALVDEDFDFYRRKLSGTKENRERWERVLGSVNGAMGDALGQAFVAETFSPEAKELAQSMVTDLLDAFGSRIESLEWMTDQTKARAQEKLNSFTVKIGYPDKWRDYSGLELNGDTWIENLFLASRFNSRFQLSKIGQPVDKTEWGMSPQTVNAYYNPLANEIVFPAAILQPPFFGLNQSLAENYGSMGAIIGHEITHGFDDMGSQFDAQGNLNDWWTEADREEFNRRSAVLVEQFNAYVAVDDLHVNGELTLGENIADLGGLQMAYLAFQKRRAAMPSGQLEENPEQHFFMAWARSWRQNSLPETVRLQVNTDPHAPNPFRANGPLGNLPEFAEAFLLNETSEMVREADSRAKIW